ncbi:Sodium:solute symporter family-domain-containing protein [Amylocystis lapponica]|nr:Sodium:solute symporter family-domain-containing protein [Amylocystis lapponica]
MANSEGAQVLSQGVGYGIVLGIGFVFAFIMAGLSALQNRYTSYKVATSEEFNTASRSVKPGLIASGIVSAWTWAATLLQSSTVTYEYGLCGGYYYAAGATLQIFLMAVLAVRVKLIAPYCHTYLEIIHARYGNTAHFVFVTYALVTNLLVSSMMLLGGSAVVNALTGMNIYAATFLIPLGVVIYVILGGLRATFLCDFLHTFILMVVILYFFFVTYTSSEMIGGLDGMYALLQKAGELRPVSGNQDGSYLTLKSNYGLMFMAVQISFGFGNITLDQSYWQRAIASKAKTAVRAYMLGGVAWFAVPMTFSTTMGLAAVALANNPDFPYAGGLNSAEVDAGLAAPAGVVALLGKGGAVAMLILLFMAVTSSASAEMIATSSVLTFDLYKIHFRPDASPETLVRVSHVMVGVWVLIMTAVACLWNGIGISLNWLFLFAGTIYTGAVGPIVMSVLWRKQTKVAAIAGTIGGMSIGIICWLTVAKGYYGELTMETTGECVLCGCQRPGNSPWCSGAIYSTMAGNVGSCCSGFVISAIITLIKPDNKFDWSETKKINPRGRALEQQRNATMAPLHGEEPRRDTPVEPEDEKKLEATTRASSVKDNQSVDEEVENYEELTRSLKWATWSSVILSFILAFLIPIPMFLSHYIFSLRFFKAWVVISGVWLFVAAFITSILPIWESRRAMNDIGRGLIRDMFGRGLLKTSKDSGA